MPRDATDLASIASSPNPLKGWFSLTVLGVMPFTRGCIAALCALKGGSLAAAAG
jgi:hypothetical protein